MSQLQTVVGTADLANVEVTHNSMWVEVAWDGHQLRLYPDQARMLGRVLRGTADEIDRIRLGLGKERGEA